jgi:hypothetical protein
MAQLLSLLLIQEWQYLSGWVRSTEGRLKGISLTEVSNLTVSKSKAVTHLLIGVNTWTIKKKNWTG